MVRVPRVGYDEERVGEELVGEVGGVGLLYGEVVVGAVEDVEGVGVEVGLDYFVVASGWGGWLGGGERV